MSIINKQAFNAFFFLILFFFIFLFIRNAGNWLIIKDDIQNIDVIVVLMGSTGERMLQASEIYELGYSDKILMVNTHTPARDLLLQRGVLLKSNAEEAKELGIALGVPEESIKILSGHAMSTRDEADSISSYLNEDKSIKRLMLITSSYHARRSAAIFRRSISKLEDPVSVITVPSKYSEFNSRRWYADRQSAKRVVMEYTRLLYFWIWERWKV